MILIVVAACPFTGISQTSNDASRFATVVGLAQYGAHRLHLSGATAKVRGAARAGDGQVDRFAKRVKDWLQDFF